MVYCIYGLFKDQYVSYMYAVFIFPLIFIYLF